MLISVKAVAQCNPETYSLNCLEELSEGYIYLRSFNIDGLNGGKEKIEYSVVLSNSTKYLLNICTPSGNIDGINLSIYDSKREMVASNMINNALHSDIEFDCEQTGIYYLTFTFEESNKYCGGCILSFGR